MKINLLYILFFIGVYTANAEDRQTAYRWRNDDGNETTATWKAANNTAITETNNSNLILRLRLEILDFNLMKNGRTESTAFVSKNIEYSTDLSTWKTIDDDETSNHFSFADSSHLTDGSFTTQQVGTGTFSDTGVIVKTYAGFSASFEVPLNHFAETEYVIKPTMNATNSTYYFRNNELDDPTGSTYAVLTLTAPVTLSNNTLKPDSFSYNNPVNNVLTIDSKEEIKNTIIHNTSGQKVLESNSKTLYISSLKSGIYFVTINTENVKTATFKIIKE